MTSYEATAICFNCHKLAHYTSACPEPRKTNLKEIEEDEAKELGKEEP
jgi:hypothetical protein